MRAIRQDRFGGSAGRSRRGCRTDGRRSGSGRHQGTDLRLDDPLQGRQPDESRPASGAGAEQSAPCRRPACRRHRRDAGRGRAGRREGRRRLRRAARRARSRRTRKRRARRSFTTRRRATRSTTGISATRQKTKDAFAAAAHVVELDIVNNRLVPNAMEPRAAIGEYDAGSGVFTLTTTSQNPHVARLVLSAFVQIAPEHKLRVIAPDVGGGFGSKIFIYPEETVCIWAAKKVGRPVKWTADRSESFLTDAHGRDHVSKASLALDADGKHSRPARKDNRQSRRLHVELFSSSVPTYLYATLLSGQYDIPAIYAEVECGLHQHVAGRCLSWRRPTRSDLCRRTPRRGSGASVEAGSGGIATSQFHPRSFRTRRRSS